MDDKNYVKWLLMFSALQNQFRSFMVDRPELTQEMNIHELHTELTYRPQAEDLGVDDLDQEMDIELYTELTYQHRVVDSVVDELDQEMNIVLRTGLTYQHQGVDLGVDDLDQLTDLEEQSAVLEENLRRTEIEILRSRISMPQRLRNVRNLHRCLKELQAKLKTAIETLVGMSTRKYMGRTFFSRRFMPELELVRERGPLRFQSCPDIPSEDLLDFNSLKKWRSLNRTISFKRSLEDILKTLDKNLNVLEMSRKSINNKLVESSEHRNAESEILTQRHRSQSNNQEVSPSQTMPGASPQPIGNVDRETIQEPPSPNAESEIPTQRHRSQSNNPEVSPSQTMPRAAPQPIGTVHRPTIQVPPSPNAESEIPTQRHRSQSNNPEVSPSQTMPGAAPQLIGNVDRETIQEPPSQNVTRINHSRTSAPLKKAIHEEVPTTEMKTVSAKSNGNPSFSLANISTAIYKTMAASCAAILIFV